MEPVITVAALTVRFGAALAVDGVSLDVRAGEVVALLGHNGAGKTTTTRVLNGLLEPTAGRVRVLGLDPARDGVALRRRTAVLTETPTLDERLTATETLRLFADLYGVPEGVAASRARALLERFELGDRAGDRVGSYSKGMRQRLALARAMLHEPALMYLDEPTAGLDPAATRQLHDLVRRWSRAEGRSVVLCTHNLAEAEALSDRVAVLARGRLLAFGTLAELTHGLAALEVEIDVARARVLEAVAALGELEGVTARADVGGTLRVSGAGRARVPALVARLVDAGVPVYRVEPHAPTLADVYFALQERGAEVPAAHDAA